MTYLLGNKYLTTEPMLSLVEFGNLYLGAFVKTEAIRKEIMDLCREAKILE